MIDTGSTCSPFPYEMIWVQKQLLQIFCNLFSWDSSGAAFTQWWPWGLT